MAETITTTVEAARAKRKERVGEVISNKMAKTIIVRVERRFPHPKFKKVVTGYKKLYAHDEKSEAKVGDRVRLEETRPALQDQALASGGGRGARLRGDASGCLMLTQKRSPATHALDLCYRYVPS